MRAVLVTTHPIQYQVPWFQALSECPGIDLTVLFAVIPSDAQQGLEFGVKFQWNIPMLEGYQWKVLESAVPEPDLGKFAGCDTPEILSMLKSLNPDLLIVTGWHSKMLFQAVRAGKKMKLPMRLISKTQFQSLLKSGARRWLPQAQKALQMI